MKKQSAGLLVYRLKKGQPEVLIVHPGGPFWAKKDIGVWSVPKGLYEEGEDPKEAAKREFNEEIGLPVPENQLLDLGSVEQRNNKTVIVWAVEGDLDPESGQSNTFKMEWPPRSGNMQEFPEVDRAEWFCLSEATQKLNPDQVPLLERLANALHVPFGSEQIPKPSEQGSLF